MGNSSPEEPHSDSLTRLGDAVQDCSLLEKLRPSVSLGGSPHSSYFRLWFRKRG
jgi:hypothetical protein